MLGFFLPKESTEKFSKIDEELSHLGINAIIKQYEDGSRVYQIPDDQLELLPKDSRGPYIGDANVSHTLHHISLEDWAL